MNIFKHLYSGSSDKSITFYTRRRLKHYTSGYQITGRTISDALQELIEKEQKFISSIKDKELNGTFRKPRYIKNLIKVDKAY